MNQSYHQLQLWNVGDQKNRIQNRSLNILIEMAKNTIQCVTVSPAKTSPNPNRPWQSFPTLGGQMDKAWLSFSSA